jgi:integrase
VTTAQLKDWYSNLSNAKTGEPLNADRAKNVLSVGRSIFSEAASSDYFAGKGNPYDKFDQWLSSLDSAKDGDIKEVSESMPFTMAEVEAILTSNDEAYESELNMVGFNFACGLRLGELFGLAWDKVDLENRVVHIERQQTEGEFKECKSGSKRTLALTDEAVEFLKKQKPLTYLMPGVEREFLTDRIGKDKVRVVEKDKFKFVFLNPASGKPYLRADNFKDRWYKMLKNAGVQICVGEDKKRRTPYTMRHTFASRLFTNGAPVSYVCTELGNTEKVCKKHYAKIINRDQKFDHDLKNKYFTG